MILTFNFFIQILIFLFCSNVAGSAPFNKETPNSQWRQKQPGAKMATFNKIACCKNIMLWEYFRIGGLKCPFMNLVARLVDFSLRKLSHSIQIRLYVQNVAQAPQAVK